MKKPLISLILILCGTSGCTSLIFGNVKPFEEKSQSYSVLDISKTNPNWNKLTREDKQAKQDQSQDSINSDSSDMAFLSKLTGSSISLNSACKNYSSSDKNPSLKKLTDELLTGTLAPESILSREEKEMTLQNTPALETTVISLLNSQKFVVNTVVLQSGNCVFDLIFLARAEKFEKDKKEFSRFVSSLQLK